MIRCPITSVIAKIVIVKLSQYLTWNSFALCVTDLRFAYLYLFVVANRTKEPHVIDLVGYTPASKFEDLVFKLQSETDYPGWWIS
jgi:hypothetical protein